jgi:hypothetical protein
MLAVEVAKYLADQGLGEFDENGITGDIFVESMPDSPDEAIAVLTSPGLAPDNATTVARPAIQIIIRGNRDPRTAYERAQCIITAMHAKHSTYFTENGIRIMLSSCKQSEPIRLGPDENGRHEYSINIQLITGG